MTVLRRYLIIDVNTEKMRITSRDPSWSRKLKKTEYYVPLTINLPKPPAPRLSPIEVTIPPPDQPLIGVSGGGSYGDSDDEYGDPHGPEEYEYGNPVG